MTKVKLCELNTHPSGNRTWDMRLACGRVTKRTVRLKRDGAGLKDAPPAVICHCPRCLKGK